MKKLTITSLLAIAFIILNFIFVPNAAYAYTAQASAPYGVSTTTTGTWVTSGDILWADTTNHSAYLTSFTYEVYVPNLLDGFSIDYYDSNGNLIGKNPIPLDVGYVQPNTVATFPVTVNPLHGQYPSGIILELNGQTSTPGERYVYIDSATNNEGNTSTFPPPPPPPTPAPTPTPTCSL